MKVYVCICVNVLSAEYFDNSNFLNVQQLRRDDFFLFAALLHLRVVVLCATFAVASLSFHFIHCVRSFFIIPPSSSSNMTFIFIASLCVRLTGS